MGDIFPRGYGDSGQQSNVFEKSGTTVTEAEAVHDTIHI
jgi:hypothetical protein